jgi:hypothetical protein
MVRTKLKQYSLIVCLFLFLFLVIGGGLNLSAGGALIAAATGTPLLICVFNRRLLPERIEPDLNPPPQRPTALHSREVGDVVRQ